MKPASVSIIIPVFNKCDLTVQCLQALAEVTNHIPHEVIVVDNASTDATPQRMRELGGKIRYLRNQQNAGFARACNQGAAAATSNLLLFLNNDTIPLQGWLDALMTELRTHPEVAAVGSKLLYENGLVQHAGVAYARETRSPFHPYRLLRSDDPRVNHRREMQAVTAACVLIRAKWFQQCGRFSEDYQNGYEDLDLCLNIRKQGGVIVYQPRSVLFHLESQTPGRMKFDNENRALFFQRWADTLLSDEDAVYCEDGYRSLGRKPGDPEQVSLVRLNSETEQAQWAVVAQTQLLAAAGKLEECAQQLAATELWPNDAAVRRWAGALCHRFKLPAAARRHFEISLEWEDHAEVRVWLQAVTAKQPEWAMTLEKGRRGLQSGNVAAAKNHFETALLQGAPARLALPGLWQAANQAGATAEAELAAQALLALPRLDAVTAAKLQQAAGVKPLTSGSPARPLTSIIILVLNQLEHTRKCLESIAANTPTPHEVIIVDNGSTDGTDAYLQQWQAGSPNRIVIRNASNRGFAAGNNQGLAIARGDCVMLLNNDTVVTAGWLEGMFAVLEKNPRTGVVGPMSNYVSGPQLVREVGYRNLAELPGFATRWSREHAGQSFEVPRAVGFCLLATREVIDRLGGLDEQFGSGNFEDDDFCIRARLAGFSIRIAQAVFIHHTGSQTFKGANIDYRNAMLRNWDLFKTKWQMPADLKLEQGYRMPAAVPEGAALKIALPELAATHRATSKTRWEEGAPVTVAAPATPQPTPQPKAKPAKVTTITLPACALRGHLGPARECLRQKKLSAAWEATLAALAVRPFHPEAYLLLAEIALAAGAGDVAKACAEHARRLAPGFKAAKKFLEQRLKGGGKPEWLKLPEALQNSAAPQRLTVCLITKNEEKFLGQCLQSIREVAHQIIVVDTGSTDRTVDIAREHGAEVHTFAWCDDFSAARNVALEPATSDWVLVLDADEELAPAAAESLRAALRDPAVMAWRLPLVDVGREAEGRSFVPRLFRNAPGLFYVGRVHEQVFSSIEVRRAEWGLENRLGEAQLIHHGYTKEVLRDRNKIERNLRLLEQAIEEFSGEPHLLMNLGLELARSGREAEALARYQEAFAALSAKPAAEVVPELRESLLTQLCTRLTAGRHFAEIARVLTSPLARSGSGLTASLHFSLGLAHLELKQFSEAANQMRQCLETRQQPGLCPINSDIHTAAPYHCLAMCLLGAGQPEAADEAFAAGLEATGHAATLRMDYARFLAQQNRPVEALQRLNEIIAADTTHVAAWRLGGQIALSRPEFLEFACDWTGEAFRHLPEDLVLTAQRAELLLLSQDAAAADLWQRLSDHDGAPVAVAALILCQVATGEAANAPESAAEPTVSKAFVQWCQKLAEFKAQETITALAENLETLRAALPTAAGLLQAALAEANSAKAAAVS